VREDSTAVEDSTVVGAEAFMAAVVVAVSMDAKSPTGI
jgi:hypothetical protein